jgi:hypothetical protein
MKRMRLPSMGVVADGYFAEVASEGVVDALAGIFLCSRNGTECLALSE